MTTGERLKQLRGKKTLAEHGKDLGVSATQLSKIETDQSNPSFELAAKICELYGVSMDWLMRGIESETGVRLPLGESNGKVIGVQYVDLEYISVKARASFVELAESKYATSDRFQVLAEPRESYLGQVIIEIDGDSMEPNFVSGTKVRCKEVDRGDWIYLNSGVYVVVYSSFFVVKRVKNSPTNGILTLHSDNTETGGTTNVQLEDVRKIWKVLRIVDAPVR